MRVPECFIHATLGPGVVGMCEGPMQRAHLIPKQVIKRELGLAGKTRSYDSRNKSRTLKILWDERVWRWMCEKHHHHLDNTKKVRLKREHIPEDTERYAREHALLWRLDRDYGERELAA